MHRNWLRRHATAISGLMFLAALSAWAFEGWQMNLTVPLAGEVGNFTYTPTNTGICGIWLLPNKSDGDSYLIETATQLELSLDQSGTSLLFTKKQPIVSEGTVNLGSFAISSISPIEVHWRFSHSDSSRKPTLLIVATFTETEKMAFETLATRIVKWGGVLLGCLFAAISLRGRKAKAA